MKNHRLRWALLCVAATHGALLSTNAEAATTVVIKPGDSIDSLARKYNVSKRDIAEANGISVDALLIDGRKLIIPDPPNPLIKKHTMRRAAIMKGNRVAIRMGPSTDARRITLLDHGAPLVVTRNEGKWLQVTLEDGQQGWVRSDFVSIGTTLVAARSTKTTKTAARRTAGKEQEDRNPPRHKTQVASVPKRNKKRVASVSSPVKNRHGQRRLAQNSADDRPTEPNRSSDSSAIVRTAFSYRGSRYRYGGSSRGGFDCSGFTRHVYAQNGIYLPHNSGAQAQCGKKVSKDELKEGDLVFFSTTRRGISHVGIYVGDGKFVHASSSRGQVRVDSLNEGYYKERYRGARRIK